MEEVVYRGRTSLRSHIGSLLAGGLVVLVGVGVVLGTGAAGAGFAIIAIAAAFLVVPYVKTLASEFSVSSERAVQRTGLISRSTSEVELSDVRNVQVSQGALQRLLGVGDVLISSAGQGGFEIRFVGIADPQGVADTVRQARKRIASS